MVKMNNLELQMRQARINKIPTGWKLLPVGKVCRIRNDLRKPISVEERSKIQGVYPYYGPTGILDYINEYLVEGSFALIGEDGDHFLKYSSKPQTLLVEGQFNVNNHAHIIQSTEKCTAEWFYNYFKHRNITSFLTRQGAGRYKLNKETLEKLPILVPTVSEQKIISSLLEYWSHVIVKTERLIEAKEKRHKFLIKQLITQNPNRHQWGRHILGKFVKERCEYSTEHDQHPVLTSSRRGIFLQEEYFSKRVASDSNIGYKIVHRGDITFRSMSDDGLFIFNQLLSLDTGIISPAYGVLFAKGMDERFLYYFLNSSVFRRVLEREIQGGTRKALRCKAITNFEVNLPSLDEQKRISMLLDLSAQELDLEQQRLYLIKRQERGLMQKLLSGQWRVKSGEEIES